eukprot:865791-Amorphochlora_amoeboformis.AAC.1
MFLEKHFYESGMGGISWSTIQYMICEVQYGGRITDDFDRRLFNTFGSSWLSQNVFHEDFRFCDSASLGGGKRFEYVIPRSETINTFRRYIETVPDNDIPSLFGLHSNADLTLGQIEAKTMLDLIQTTRPREASGSEGKTPQQIVSELSSDLLSRVPKLMKMDDIRQLIVKRPKTKEIEWTLSDAYNPNKKITGIDIPLNVFLFQEIERLSKIIMIVKDTLRDVGYAIKGEIIMTPQLSDAIDAMFDGRPPRHWYVDAGGVEIAWTDESLPDWFDGLLLRHKQLMDWLTSMRPNVYWMTGFFNPQGFLTAMRQEVTRRHAANGWALDEVVLHTEVLSKVTDPSKFKMGSNGWEGKEIPEGVYIHGLFLEGASWDADKGCLGVPKVGVLFDNMPVIHVTALKQEEAERRYAKSLWYDCPVYTKKKRTDLNFIYTPKIKIPTDERKKRRVISN